MRTGVTLIPDKLKHYVDAERVKRLLMPILERSRGLRSGKSVFDYMTNEEYETWNTLIEDALQKSKLNNKE